MKSSGVDEWGGDIHHCPDKTTVAFGGCISYLLPNRDFFFFYIISLRNKTMLGLSEACGCYLGFRAKPTLSAALGTVCAWLCFFNPCGERPVSLLSFPLLPSLSGSHLMSHGHFTPWAFPLCCWSLLKSGPTWASPRIGSVPFKDSQIDSQRLIKMEFHALLVPLGDVKEDPIQSLGNASQMLFSSAL